MNRLRRLIEWNAFGVCTYLGEKWNISTASIRKYFIYISFLTLGSPVVIYFFVAFWMNIKQYIGFYKRNPVRW
ncbi:MAG: PspC family transcriptional regulator [Chitinophagaceae bacterium]|nr:PspC family transcriptional regulator [Chitinophagaceae bacterium]